MRAFHTGILSWRLSSPLRGLLILWMLLPPHHFFAALVDVISYFWRWLKDCQGLFHLGGSSKTGSARERQSSCIWGSAGEGRVELSQPKDQILWPMRTAGGAKSWRFWRGECLLPKHSVKSTVIKYRQLCSPCPGGNWFESGNKKVSEPSGFIWNLSMNQ